MKCQEWTQWHIKKSLKDIERDSLNSEITSFSSHTGLESNYVVFISETDVRYQLLSNLLSSE